MKNIAVLLTCHNRKDKTLSCLQSLYNAELPDTTKLNVFLVDDGSTDGTAKVVKESFPKVNIIQGTGNLYWAGGMRLAWNVAINNDNYDAFLLLNDDTVLYNNAITDLLSAHNYCLEKYNKAGIYIGSTRESKTGEFTYGGKRLKSNNNKIIPNDNYQLADLANANILVISKDVYNEVGIFDSKYTHGIADYDYSLRAKKYGYPLIVCPNYQGECNNDHGNNWKSSDTTLKERINYLYSPTGLAYNEYIYYIKKHFGGKAYFISIIKLWLKTIFPVLWDRFK